jgi:lipoprotein NlpI
MNCPMLTRVLLVFLAGAALSASPRASPGADAPREGESRDAIELLAEARAALRRGDAERAISLATDALAKSPDDAAAYALRAAAHDVRRDFEKSIADWDKLVALRPDDPAAFQRRGETHFRLGRFKESVADFDKVIALEPDRAAHDWQRGISLYYAGDYAGGAKQFESHRAVNPEDVENAAWHYLCVARTSGVDAARRSLIPVKDDARVPMMRVFDLFAGTAGPDDVLAAAKAGDPPPEQKKTRLFYAHLYIGLYHEAAGAADKAGEHILLAEKYAGDDYMGDVARVHAVVIKAAAK